MEAIIRRATDTRLVYANIGIVNKRINFDAPIISSHSIHGIPYFFLLDSSCRPAGEGDSAINEALKW